MDGIVINAGAMGGISADLIAQEPGESDALLMSQKAVTELIDSIAVGTAARIEVPVPDGMYSYTGSEIVPVFAGYLEDCLTLSGDTAATNVGTYAAIFTPKLGYAWMDGTTEPAKVQWEISKAQGTCELSALEVRVIRGSSARITITRRENAEMTVTTVNGTAASGAVSDNTVTVIGAQTGTARLRIDAAETANYTAAFAYLDVTVCVPVDIPQQSGILTYNGSPQTVSFGDYDTSGISIYGTTAATDAGTYEATATLAEYYVWADGTIGQKKIPWIIQKADACITIDETSLSLFSGNSSSVSVSRSGNGTISASSSVPTVASCSVSSMSVVITGISNGSCIVTIRTAESSNHKACSVTVNVNVKAVSTTLGSNSWSVISEIVQSGNAANYWKVGDGVDTKIQGMTAGMSLDVTLKTIILHFDYRKSTCSAGKSNILLGIGWKNSAGADVALCHTHHEEIVMKARLASA